MHDNSLAPAAPVSAHAPPARHQHHRAKRDVDPWCGEVWIEGDLLVALGTAALIAGTLILNQAIVANGKKKRRRRRRRKKRRRRKREEEEEEEEEEEPFLHLTPPGRR